MGPKERERVVDRLRRICLCLPEVEERPSHGAPTFFVRGKRAFVMVLTNHHGDERFAIWCAAGEGVQTMLVRVRHEPSLTFTSRKRLHHNRMTEAR